MVETRISLKFLIDKRKQRVLFADGGKDFVDFLFTILSLSVGAVIKILTKSAMGDSLIKLYESLEVMDPTYMKQRWTNVILLCTEPIDNRCNSSTPCLGGCGKSLSNVDSEYCEVCLSRTMIYVAFAAGVVKVNAMTILNGYVADKVTYMIMDDLVVKPLSAVTLLSRIHINEIGAVEEKVVYIVIKEALDSLKASLQSTTVLMDAFLAQEKA